jgi:hypothetical protein
LASPPPAPALDFAVVAGINALVTGAATGIVVARLVVLGSRLALVTEERLELADALAVNGHVRIGDAALTRDRLGTERIHVGVELQSELDVEAVLVQDRARES